MVGVCLELNDLNKTLTAAYEKEKKERQRLVASGPQAAAAPVEAEPSKGTKELERTVKEQAKKTKEQADQSESSSFRFGSGDTEGRRTSRVVKSLSFLPPAYIVIFSGSTSQ